MEKRSDIKATFQDPIKKKILQWMFSFHVLTAKIEYHAKNEKYAA